MQSSINKRFANSKWIWRAAGNHRSGDRRRRTPQTGFVLALALAAGGAMLADPPWSWPASNPPAPSAAQKNPESNKDAPEYAPIVERRLDVYDFTFKTPEGAPFNLRDYAAGKRIVIINFLAGWCKNSNRNGHVIERLYTKYRERGLGVVAVMEYSDPSEARIHINRIGIDYPVVIETQKRGARKDSVHYKYRRLAGDRREWGTPFYIVFDGRNLNLANTAGARAALATQVYTIAGEMNEAEAERFLDEKLSQKAEGRKQDARAYCVLLSAYCLLRSDPLSPFVL